MGDTWSRRRETVVHEEEWAVSTSLRSPGHICSGVLLFTFCCRSSSTWISSQHLTMTPPTVHLHSVCGKWCFNLIGTVNNNHSRFAQLRRRSFEACDIRLYCCRRRFSPCRCHPHSCGSVENEWNMRRIPPQETRSMWGSNLRWLIYVISALRLRLSCLHI